MQALRRSFFIISVRRFVSERIIRVCAGNLVEKSKKGAFFCCEVLDKHKKYVYIYLRLVCANGEAFGFPRRLTHFLTWE